MTNVVEKGVNLLSKGVGNVVGGVAGIGVRTLKGGGGIIKEAVTGVGSGIKTGYEKMTGKTARLAKESAEMAEKAAKEAEEKVAMKTRRLTQATEALYPDFVGPHTATAIEDARQLNTIMTTANPDFVGPMPSEFEIRSAYRYVQENLNPDFVGPMPVSQAHAESGVGFWDEIPDWAKMTGTGVAGLIAGGVLLGDDDYE